MNGHTKPALAELLGTFMLVFIGAGSGVLAGSDGGIVRVALAHGFALMVIIYAIGGVSGAHVNPAITLGVTLAGKMTWARAMAYWAAQIVGGVLAAFALSFVLGDKANTLGLGTTELGRSTTPFQGFVVEIILTIFLALAVMISGVYGKNGNMAGLAIGSVLVMDIFMGGDLTGASMNPARSLGPAFVNGAFPNWWVYILGPAIGASLGALIAKKLHSED